MAFGPNLAPGRNVTRLSNGIPSTAKSICSLSISAAYGRRLKVLIPLARDGWGGLEGRVFSGSGKRELAILAKGETQTQAALAFPIMDVNITSLTLRMRH